MYHLVLAEVAGNVYDLLSTNQYSSYYFITYLPICWADDRAVALYESRFIYWFVLHTEIYISHALFGGSSHEKKNTSGYIERGGVESVVDLPIYFHHVRKHVYTVTGDCRTVVLWSQHHGFSVVSISISTLDGRASLSLTHDFVTRGLEFRLAAAYFGDKIWIFWCKIFAKEKRELPLEYLNSTVCIHSLILCRK